MNELKNSTNDSQNSKPDEKTPEFWEAAAREISNGNDDAYVIIVAWGELCHLLDDIVDKDKERTPTDLIRIILSWTMVCSRNSLYLNHADKFNALAMVSMNAYLDSVTMEKSEDPGQRQYADAYRSFYGEMGLYVAFLAGGWDHYRKVSAKFRDAHYYSQRAFGLQEYGVSPIPLITPQAAPPELAPKEQGRRVGKKERSRPLILPYQLRTDEDWERFKTFAESFDHPVDRRFPHVVIKDSNDRWIGYGMMMCVPAPGSPGMPLACTGWHPSATQRECVRGMQLLTDWALMSYGRAATVIPFDSPLLPHMEALGYSNWNLHFFATKP
jgi:hypothetical protein